jgi:hypothetical protein
MNKRHKIFQIGAIIVIYINIVYHLFFSGGEIDTLFYYTFIPLAFCFLLMGYPNKNWFIWMAFFSSCANSLYNFLKLIGYYDYDYEGIKVFVPTITIGSMVIYGIKYYFKIRKARKSKYL